MDENVERFIALTGTSVEIAKNLLEACAGNLDMAINMHLDNDSSAQRRTDALMDRRGLEDTSERSVTMEESTETDRRSYEEIHGVRAPIPQTQGVLIEQEIPRRSFQRRALPRSIFDPFQDYSEASYSNKQRTLAELFKPPYDIMFQGTLQEARRAGQAQSRWLLVNVQDSSEFQCQTLNRDLWSNGKIQKIIKDHFVFLQIQRITDEGIKFRQLYDVDSFPSILIIDPRTGEKMSHWSSLSIDDFQSKIQEFLSINTLSHEALFQEQSTLLVYNQSESEQLEAAIKASLEDTTKQQSYYCIDSDNESDALLSPVDSESEYEDNALTDTVSASNSVPISSSQDQTSSYSGNRYFAGHKRHNDTGEEYETKLKKPKLSLNRTNSIIPNTDHEVISDQTDNALSSYSEQHNTKLIIRYPDGRRSLKTFAVDCQIKELFAYLHEEGIDLREYEVITTFPHCVISSLSSNVTFRDAGLYPSQTVFVQLAE